MKMPPDDTKGGEISGVEEEEERGDVEEEEVNTSEEEERQDGVDQEGQVLGADAEMDESLKEAVKRQKKETSKQKARQEEEEDEGAKRRRVLVVRLDPLKGHSEIGRSDLSAADLS